MARLGKYSNIPLLKFALSTQNSRLTQLNQPKKLSCDDNSNLTQSPVDQIIERCYQQIFFHPLASDRDKYLESQLRSGSINTRDFMRGLLLSDRFYRGYLQCNSNYRIVDQVIGKLLGRLAYGDGERIAWSIVIATNGLASFIDEILNSEEYMVNFGYDVPPYQRSRVLPGSPTENIPIYQLLPRYSDYWRDKLISEGMFYLKEKLTLEAIIYKKPSGRILLAWIAVLLIFAITLATIIALVIIALLKPELAL
ncbi:phycobilisome linker polypeptide [cyanobiont of Ornithocercus magnificus]|nr:phycobilisome linker polypeptide [cyanobiont of Ornithocercus magnificus]